MNRSLRIAFVTAVLAAFLPLSSVSAQNTPGTWHLGLHGGVAASEFRGDDVGGSDFRTGLTTGLSLTYDVNEVFSMQPGVLYTIKGGDDVGRFQQRVRFDYLEIPVLFKLSAPLQPVTPRLYAGPALGILLAAETAGLNVYDDVSRLDLGGVVGGELAFNLSRFNRVVDEIAIDGRYSIGFIGVDEIEDADIFNNNFSGQLSLRFAL